MQPHRYTRLRDLFDDFCSCFNDADQVVLAPVYEAGEQPIEGADHTSLADGLRARGHRAVYTISHHSEIAPLINDTAQPGDVVICLGAGNITQWAMRFLVS
jgi:UDP-N-acetylmuramate--alanine ligase